MKWLKWWCGSVEDAKFRMASRFVTSRHRDDRDANVRDVIAVWAVLLEDAAHDDHWGTATRGPAYWGAVLDLDPGLVEAMCEAMAAADLITWRDSKAMIKHWNSRQAKDPGGASRSKAYRDRRRNGGDTERHGTVTPASPQDLDLDIDSDKREGANAPKAANGSKKPATSERGTRLSPDWTPSEKNLADAYKIGLNRRDVEREAANFVDYWVSKPGSAGVHLSWDRTWSRWCRSTAEKLGRPTPPTPASYQTNVVPGPRGLPQTDDEWLELLVGWRTTRKWPIYAGPHPMTTQSKVPRHLYAKAQLDSPDANLVKKGLSPDEQRELLAGVKAGQVAMSGPAPGQPGSLISPEIAREAGYL